MEPLEYFRLDNKVSFKGFWSLNFDNLINNCGEYVPGILQIDKGEIYLDLNGDFNETNSDSINFYDRVFGYLNNGIVIILEKCFNINRVHSCPGYITSKYKANFLYSLSIDINDINLIKNSEIKINQVNFSVNYFCDFFDINSLIIENDDLKKITTISYNDNFYQEYKFSHLEKKYFLSLRKSILRYHSSDNNFKIDSIPYMSIYTNDLEQKSLDEFLVLANWTMSLYDFLLQTSSVYNFFEFINKEENNTIQDQSFENKTINYTGRFVFPHKVLKFKESKSFILKFSDMFSDFDKLIDKWFQNKKELEYIVDLYYQNTESNFSIKTKLVNKIQMLETYYDNFIINKREEVYERQNKINNVVTDVKIFLEENNIEIPIKEEIISMLDRNRIKPNKIHLREKLTILLKSLPRKLKNHLSTLDSNFNCQDDSIEKYADLLKNTRNSYIHGSIRERKLEIFNTLSEVSAANLILDYTIYYLVVKILYDDEQKVVNLTLSNLIQNN